MIDVAGYNATVCFTETNSNVYSGNQKRRHFISDLAEQLCKPQILRRFRDVRANFPSQIIQCMKAFVSDEDTAPPSTSQHQESKKRRCSKCPRKMDKNTKKSCASSGDLVCDAHCHFICKQCSSNLINI